MCGTHAGHVLLPAVDGVLTLTRGAIFSSVACYLIARPPAQLAAAGDVLRGGVGCPEREGPFP